MMFVDGYEPRYEPDYEPDDVIPTSQKDDSTVTEQDRAFLLDIFNTIAPRFNHMEETKAYIEAFIACVNKQKEGAFTELSQSGMHYYLSLSSKNFSLSCCLHSETGNIHFQQCRSSAASRILTDIALEEVDVCFTAESGSGKLADHTLISNDHIIAHQYGSMTNMGSGIYELFIPAKRAIPLLKKVFAYYLSDSEIAPEIKKASMQNAKMR